MLWNGLFPLLTVFAIIVLSAYCVGLIREPEEACPPASAGCSPCSGFRDFRLLCGNRPPWYRTALIPEASSSTTRGAPPADLDQNKNLYKLPLDSSVVIACSSTWWCSLNSHRGANAPGGRECPWRTVTFSTSVLTFFLGIAFSGHHTPLFFSACSASCTPVAHWDADRRGSSRYISWYQNQLTLTTCHIRHHIAVWDNRSIRQL
jgi:hypothetical protein